MELYSKEELLKELKKEYSCGGECDHCPEVLDAGSCSVLRCIRRIIDNATPIETDIEVVAKDAYKQGYTEGWKERFGEPDERTQGEWIEDDYAGIHCSECSYIPLKDVVIKKYADGTEERSGNFNLTPYCPNCGVRMKGGAEE